MVVMVVVVAEYLQQYRQGWSWCFAVVFVVFMVFMRFAVLFQEIMRIARRSISSRIHTTAFLEVVDCLVDVFCRVSDATLPHNT